MCVLSFGEIYLLDFPHLALIIGQHQYNEDHLGVVNVLINTSCSWGAV
jgi:hypothetical protein